MARPSARGCGALALIAVGCGACSSQTARDDSDASAQIVSAPAPPAAAERAVRSAKTDGGTYTVEWSSEPAPIAFDQPFELDVRVLRDERPQDGVQVALSAWMPAHRHGMVRQPETTPLGDGRYRVRGLLFHMSGQWKLFVDLGFEGKFERAEFDLVLAPEESALAVAEFSGDEVARILERSPLPDPPDDATNAYDTDERAARLGQFLFFDRGLSTSGEFSCATCHVSERDWSDGKALASATEPLQRNTPALWNVAYNRWFFWDGRSDSLWSQALHPLEDAREMAGDRTSIARHLQREPELRRAYEAIFGALPELDAARFPASAAPMPDRPGDERARRWSEMSAADREAIDRVFANVGKSLAAFERELVSRASPFDDFVRGLRDGDPDLIASIPPEARRGLKLFLGKANCHACHAGPNFTDREFHNNRIPVREDLPLDLGRFKGLTAVQTDPFNALGAFSDGHEGDARDKLEYLVVSGEVWGQFKTPSLRNVAMTAPYMHQGQLATLEDVVEFYSDRIRPPNLHGEDERVLVPLHLSADEKSDLVAFLRSLTDTSLPAELRTQPPTPFIER